MTNQNQHPRTDAPNDVQLLTGPRQLGAIPGPNGSSTVHGVTGDGAKFTRVHGEPYASAADFHAQQLAEADRFEDITGVRPAGAPPRQTEEQPTPVEPPERTSRIGGAIGKLLGR